jgi:hypothetical protein
VCQNVYFEKKIQKKFGCGSPLLIFDGLKFMSIQYIIVLLLKKYHLEYLFILDKLTFYQFSRLSLDSLSQLNHIRVPHMQFNFRLELDKKSN